MTKKERVKIGLLKIGEIAEEAGVNKTTVRYYTDMGLINYVDTTPGGYRLYDRDETVDKIHAIREMMSKNITLWQLQDDGLLKVFA
ncbi:MerR family transcriptional regulator [Elusimicrobiota bacterium]